MPSLHHLRRKKGRPASEERIIAGFEEIQRFTEQHGRVPQHGEERDIFERPMQWARPPTQSPQTAVPLEPLDHQGLLAGGGDVAESADEIIDIDNLAAELADVSSEDDITVLRHVRASTEKRVVQGVADRKPCEDFDNAFKPLFEQVPQ